MERKNYRSEDFYHVETVNGVKTVHMHSYGWDDDGFRIKFHGNELFTPEEITDIDSASEYGFASWFDVNDRHCEIQEVNESEYEEWLTDMLEKASELQLSSVTEDTPDGLYIDI